MNYLVRPSMTRTQRKISEFADLEQGWHYGRGGAISAPVIRRALALYDTLLLEGLTRTDAFAGADGEILVTAYRGDHYLGITIEPDELYSLVHEVEGREEDEFLEGLDHVTLKKRLGEIAASIWNTFASSTHGTTTQPKAVSTTSHSSDQWTVGCLYSSSNALRPQAA